MAENQSVWNMKIKAAQYYTEKAYTVQGEGERWEKDHIHVWKERMGKGAGKMDHKEEE